MPSRLVALVLALVGVAVPAGATGGHAIPGRAELRRIAAEVRRATNAPGAIVGVQVGDRPPTLVAVGTRDRHTGTPIRADDAFVGASVTKAYTAAVVLELVARHRLRLDDRVVRFVPGWDRRITVRQLLDHSSGLPSWGNKDDPPDSPRDALETADFARSYTMAESLAPVRAMPLLAPPGRATHYSNANTLLAGLVVERVTGTSLAAAFHRYVLDPLRLRSTGYIAQETPPRAPIPGVLYADDARTVEVDTSQYPQTSNLTLGGPSIAMVTNAPDLLRFSDAFLRGRFPDRRLARQAHRIGPGGAGLGIIGFTRTGYCIFDGCSGGPRFGRYGLAGNGPGTAVRVVYDPDRDTTAFVFANSSERGRLDPLVLRVFAGR